MEDIQGVKGVKGIIRELRELRELRVLSGSWGSWGYYQGVEGIIRELWVLSGSWGSRCRFVHRVYFFFEVSILLLLYEFPADSSVGRAMDCSSIGHVFNSHSTETGLIISYKHYNRSIRLSGLVVWYSLWVRVVSGSIPDWAQIGSHH